MKIKVSQNLRDLAFFLRPYAKLFIVGGYIRNGLLGITETDVDLASSLPPEKLAEILKGTRYEVIKKNTDVGYLQIKVDGEVYEHTTFRRDNYFQDGRHKVKSVNYVDDVREDAMRRDFTINALYYDIETGKIIDIYSGVLDLKAGVIRTVEVPGFVLAHDGRRILRMVRLASELGFKVDYATLVAAKKYTRLLHDISPSIKFTELMAILHASKKFSISKKGAHLIGLNYFNQLHLWNSFFITITKVKFKMVKRVKYKNIFYGFLIDVIDTLKPDCIEYFLKDLLGKKGFCLPKKFFEDTNTIICGYYDAIHKMNNKFYFFKYYEYFEEIAELLQSYKKTLYSKYKFFYSYINKHNLPVKISELAISGEDLIEHCPELNSKKYNVVLVELLSKVFDGELTNDKHSLIQEVKNGISNNRY